MNEPETVEEAIYHAARRFADPAKLRAYLDLACEGKPELRRRIERLLGVSFEADSFFERHVVPAASALAPAVAHLPDEFPAGGAPSLLAGPLTEGPGTVIGRYKLLEQIGEGGFGFVFMAQQEEPIRRRVALKIIKPGMDTKLVVARFEAERQALALMDHPNIARVLDGGATDTGRPYFVMELVQGVPITQFCDQNHFSVEDRITLFMPVCQAVQSAHQKGVIHRDIKPSNVLVTLHDGVPVPKVIDFGVAKATNQKLTEKTLFTNFAMMIGTPAYMSPEQAEMSGLDIDTRSDIYSLGVVLYELLTGTTPFSEQRLRSVSYSEMQRIILEEEPERPSTRLRRVQLRAPSPIKDRKSKIENDLDWIVLKCLEKDRNRRYPSANGLAADLKRYLESEPVVPRPPTAVYRVRKFVRRNRAWVAAATMVTATLLIGSVVSTWQAVRARRAERLATQQRLEAEAARRQAQAQELAARQRAYASDMSLAYEAWQEGNLARAQELIEANRPAPGQKDLPTFEWRYLWKLCQDQSQMTFSSASGGINSAAFCPDGRALILADATTLKLVDRATQREQVVLEDAEGIWHPVFSPAANHIVAARAATNTIKLWNLATKQLLAALPAQSGTIKALAFSPDGRTLASAGWNQPVNLWPVQSGSPAPRALTTYDRAGLNPVFSPDGQYLVTAGNASATKPPVRIFDLATGQEAGPRLEGHIAWVHALAISPDGRRLASGGNEGIIFVWDFATRKLLFQLAGHGGQVLALAFSPDGRRLVSGGADHTIRIWDLAGQRQIDFRRGHRAPLDTVIVSPDGRALLSVARPSETEPTKDGVAKLWDLDEAEARNVLVGPQSVLHHLAISPDGKTLATAIYDALTIQVWDVPSRRLITNLTAHSKGFPCVAFSPDGKLLAAGGLLIERCAYGIGRTCSRSPS